MVDRAPYKPRIFLATPFGPERAGHEDADVFARVQASIQAAADQAAVELDHPAAVHEAGRIIDQVFERLETADAVLAVVTGQNPNVLFELGFAARRAPILIVDDPEKLPFDLRIYRAISYGAPGELETLADRTARAIHETLAAAAERIDPPIRDYLEAVGRQARQGPAFFSDLLRARDKDVMTDYVPLRLESQSSGAVKGEQPTFDPAQLLARGSVASALPPHCLVVGLSGSGKSTLLHVLAAKAWENPKQIGSSEALLPMLVSLSAIARVPGSEVSERLKQALDEDRSLVLFTQPPEDFVSAWSRRTRRHWLFLLDGLDEVPRPLLPSLGRWIREFSRYCSSNGHRIVMTTCPSVETAELESCFQMFRLQPLSDNQLESLVNSHLNRESERFLREIDGSRLKWHLQIPLLLKLAMSFFRTNGSLPVRRVDLIEHFLEQLLAAAFDRSLRSRLGDTVAAGIPQLLVAIAAAPLDGTEDAVFHFLREELALPETEARGRALPVLRDLASSGILVCVSNQYLIPSPILFSHLAACGLKRCFDTRIERNTLIENGWNSEKMREPLLGFLALLDDEKEVGRLLRRIYPTSWLQRVRKRMKPALPLCQFLVDAILDGCKIDTDLRTRLEYDLATLSRDSGAGPEAAELLGRLGDSKHLLRWARSPECGMPVAYAIAALFRLGEASKISSLVSDPSLPVWTRVAAFLTLNDNESIDLATEIIGKPDTPIELQFAALHALGQSGKFDAVRQLLRHGSIKGELLEKLSVLCAQKRDLDLLWNVSHDPDVEDEVRKEIQKNLIIAVVAMLQILKEDLSIDRTLRDSAASLVAVLDAPSQPIELAPLMMSDVLSPTSKVAVALLALGYDSSSLTRLCDRTDIPMDIQAAIVEVLSESESFDALVGISNSDTAPTEIRRLARARLIRRDTGPTGEPTTSLPSHSSPHRVATEVPVAFLQSVIRDAEEDDQIRLAALVALANRGDTEPFRDVIKDPGPDERLSKLAIGVAREVSRWPLIKDIACDPEIDKLSRAVAITILGEKGCQAELREIAQSKEVPSVLSALARKQLGRDPDNKQ